MARLIADPSVIFLLSATSACCWLLEHSRNNNKRPTADGLQCLLAEFLQVVEAGRSEGRLRCFSRRLPNWRLPAFPPPAQETAGRRIFSAWLGPQQQSFQATDITAKLSFVALFFFPSPPPSGAFPDVEIGDDAVHLTPRLDPGLEWDFWEIRGSRFPPSPPCVHRAIACRFATGAGEIAADQLGLAPPARVQLCFFLFSLFFWVWVLLAGDEAAAMLE
jgi:hypothetical protein